MGQNEARWIEGFDRAAAERLPIVRISNIATTASFSAFLPYYEDFSSGGPQPSQYFSLFKE